jgi:hypothetical protein
MATALREAEAALAREGLPAEEAEPASEWISWSLRLIAAHGACLANLGAARRLHTATLLPDGRLLVTGGYGVGGRDTVATAELYGPGIGN